MTIYNIFFICYEVSHQTCIRQIQRLLYCYNPSRIKRVQRSNPVRAKNRCYTGIPISLLSERRRRRARVRYSRGVASVLPKRQDFCLPLAVAVREWNSAWSHETAALSFSISLYIQRRLYWHSRATRETEICDVHIYTCTATYAPLGVYDAV